MFALWFRIIRGKGGVTRGVSRFPGFEKDRGNMGGVSMHKGGILTGFFFCCPLLPRGEGEREESRERKEEAEAEREERKWREREEEKRRDRESERRARKRRKRKRQEGEKRRENRRRGPGAKRNRGDGEESRRGDKRDQRRERSGTESWREAEDAHDEGGARAD